MPVIARCNGVLLVENGASIEVVDQGGGWRGTAIFVAALLAVILIVNGGVFVVTAPAVGAGLLAGGALAGVVAWKLVQARRRAATAAPGPPRLVFDRAARVLRDGDGATIARLEELRLARTWQAGSSSKALTVKHPRGSIVIARGTPFGDSVEDVERHLTAALAASSGTSAGTRG